MQCSLGFTAISDIQDVPTQRLVILILGIFILMSLHSLLDWSLISLDDVSPTYGQFSSNETFSIDQLFLTTFSSTTRG